MITINNGFYIRLYDAKHKQITESHITSKETRVNSGNVESIFEINNDLVILFSTMENKIRGVYRITIDGITGSVKENKKITDTQTGEERKVEKGAIEGVYNGNYVNKDPNSNNYAVAMFNNPLADRDKRLEVIAYDSTGKETSRALYKSPGEKYEYLKYIDMAVIGNSKVCVLAYGYTYKKSSSIQTGDLILATLDAGSKEVSVQELEYSKDMIITGGIMRFNPVFQKLVLLAASRSTKKDEYYGVSVAYVDPFVKKLDRGFDIYPVHANEKCLELFGKKKPFTGMPQNLFINNDGSFTVVYEEMTNYYNTRSSNCELGNIAVSLFDKDGRENNSYLIPKNHMMLSTSLNPFYQAKRDLSGSSLTFGDQYKSFTYLNGKKKNYVLMNDIERNGETVLDGKITTISGVGECNGFYFVIDGKETMPQRKFLFGAPASKKENNLALFTISDYDREKNIYVTLKLEKEGKSKGVKFVWLQPQ